MKTILKLFVVSILAIGSNTLFAQTSGLKITTGHPDIKVKIQRCEASGSTCVIDFIIQNAGSSDIDFGLVGGNGYVAGSGTKVYDDEGNMYGRDAVYVGFGSNLTRNLDPQTLPAGIPRKARIQIEGVATAATNFLRIDLRANSNSLRWRFDADHKILLENVPITREGD